MGVHDPKSNISRFQISRGWHPCTLSSHITPFLFYSAPLLTYPALSHCITHQEIKLFLFLFSRNLDTFTYQQVTCYERRELLVQRMEIL